MSHLSFSVLSPRLERAPVWQKVVSVLLGTLVLAVAAHVAVPFWPVPMTLQTLAILLIGVVAGPLLAAATVVAYVAEGLTGLPVFSHGTGLAALAGPTGGYIVGFLPAAVLVGFGAQRGWLRGLAGALSVFAAADALVFACGLAWLAPAIGFDKAVTVGLVPFLLGEVLKIALAMAVIRVRLNVGASRR